MSDRTIEIGTILDEYYDCEDTERVGALNAHYELLNEKTPSGGRRWRVVANPPEPDPTPEQIMAKYDNALEQHISDAIVARGYTKREPSAYGKDQTDVVRYKQDAVDFKHFRDQTMLTGLRILNEYKQTGKIPTMEEFLAALPQVHWTIDPNNENMNEGMVIEE